MNPEELTKEFFTKCLGWEWKAREDALPGNFCWHDGPREIGTKLPNLTEEITGLGLQEKWVWPLLREKGWNKVTFIDEDYCRIEKRDRAGQYMVEAFAKTKRHAQLQAALNALRGKASY